MEEFDCKKCLHEKVCALWASRESQNASCFCTDGCDYFTPTLTPPNEWVSVDERLPEYNPGTGAKSYWVAKKDNAGNWQMKIAQYCDYGYAMTVDAKTEVTWRDWDFTKIVNVTHWMSLPEPPDRRPPEGEA